VPFVIEKNDDGAGSEKCKIVPVPSISLTMSHWRRFLSRVVGAVLIALGTLCVGTLIHETGHALAAMACGARVVEVNVVGLTLYPALRFGHQPGFLGYVRFERALPSPQSQYVSIAGSLSTLVVGLLAQAVLWLVPPRRMWSRLIGFAACFLTLDVAWHTMVMLLGLRSASYAETHTALVALGALPWLAAGMTLGVPLVSLALTPITWRRLIRRL